VPTDEGRNQAAQTLRDESRWQELRRVEELAELAPRDDGLTRIEDILTPDQIKLLDQRLNPQGVQ
jgi:manganese/zinc/iron transport system permease protein